MGKRFSRCLGISKYSTVLDNEDAFGTDIYDENAIKAITIDVGMKAISEGTSKCKMSHFREAISSIDTKRKGIKNNGPDRLYG